MSTDSDRGQQNPSFEMNENMSITDTSVKGTHEEPVTETILVTDSSVKRAHKEPVTLLRICSLNMTVHVPAERTRIANGHVEQLNHNNTGNYETPLTENHINLTERAPSEESNNRYSFSKVHWYNLLSSGK